MDNEPDIVEVHIQCLNPNCREWTDHTPQSWVKVVKCPNCGYDIPTTDSVPHGRLAFNETLVKIIEYATDEESVE